MIRAEIDRELNRVKVETTGDPADLEAEIIAIMLYMKREKIFTITDIREMTDSAAKADKWDAIELIR